MKILAVDTATPSCSVAVVDATGPLAEFHREEGGTHAVHLMEMIKKTLDTAGCALEEMDGIAVTRGPGSFTGVRIGMSTVKGLALACDKPVVGVSTLRAVAYQGKGDSRDILTMIDARRAEVYYALFRWENQKLIRLSIDAAGKVGDALGGIGRRSLLIGNGGLLHKKEIQEKIGDLCEVAPWEDHSPRALDVAKAAWVRFENNEGTGPGGLSPLYLRRSDAESVHANRFSKLDHKAA